jgi:hypothetical protein
MRCDILHHLWGNPIWPFMATSSWGCLIFDSLIATWLSTLDRGRWDLGT